MSVKNYFGMVLPALQFGLEQFIEMTNTLKWVKDKYKRPPYQQQNKHDQSGGGNNSSKENQLPNDSMQLTSQPSQPTHVTRNTQIGNISVEQIATSLGSEADHLVEVLEEVLVASHSTEEQDTPPP